MRSWVWTRRVSFIVLAAVLAACGDDVPGGPGIEIRSVTLNPHNQLSAIVSFEARGVDEARVVYWTEGGIVAATPFRPVTEGLNRRATLGLEPDTRYRHLVEGRGTSGILTSAPVVVHSGLLPEDLAGMELELRGFPTDGYVSATLPGYVVAFDMTGRVRWYREIDGYVGRDAGQKENNNWVAFVGTTTGSEPAYGHYVEFTPRGDMVDRVEAPFPLYTDNHELLFTWSATGVKTSHFFSYEIRTVDLTAYGGAADARVAGHQILRMTGGRVDFIWDAWDHIDPGEAAFFRPELLQTCDDCDYDHPNSLWIDDDGNYIVSWLNLSEVMKIDSRNGEILWRLGGASDDFVFVNDPLGGFRGTHFARTLENGNLLVYDNGWTHLPRLSRAVEYALDPVGGTATLVWEYRHSPDLNTPIVGSAQRLNNGNTFIGFTGRFNFVSVTGPPVVVEADPAGNEVWEGIFPEAIVVYRALKVASLDEYEP